MTTSVIRQDASRGPRSISEPVTSTVVHVAGQLLGAILGAILGAVPASRVS